MIVGPTDSQDVLVDVVRLTLTFVRVTRLLYSISVGPLYARQLGL